MPISTGKYLPLIRKNPHMKHEKNLMKKRKRKRAAELDGVDSYEKNKKVKNKKVSRCRQ